MKQLFLKTPNKTIPIDEKIIEKYKLRRGELSPFTGFPIVDENGSFEAEERGEPAKLSDTDKENAQMFTVAESIDIAEGSDSAE